MARDPDVFRARANAFAKLIADRAAKAEVSEVDQPVAPPSPKRKRKTQKPIDHPVEQPADQPLEDEK